MKRTKPPGRHELKKAREARNAIAIFVAVLAILTVSALYLDRSIGNRTKPLPSMGIPAKYSLQEMQQVWTNNFSDLMEKQLFGNTYPLPKIQERFNLQIRMIQEKYHTNLSIHLVSTYNPESLDVMAGCWVTNNQPQLDVVIPKLIDVCYEHRDRGDQYWLPRMQNELVTGVMHELDHLAYGLVSGTREHPSSLNELVDSESSAWALTCEETLRPLIEEYRVPLTQSDYIYYRKWIEAGRDGKSSMWKGFIRSLYQETRR